MNKNYSETLIMPANYTNVTENEMTYVDGGVKINYHWWGVADIVLSNYETKLVCAGWKGISKLAVPFVAKIAMKALSWVCKNANKGKGVTISMWWGVLSPVPTFRGIWSN